MPKKEEISLDELIKKEFGNVVITGDEVVKLSDEKFSVSPSIDISLGGGISVGSTVITAARPKFGKTQTALCAARNFLNTFPHGEVIHLDIESRLRGRNVIGTHGLDTSRFRTIAPLSKSKDGFKQLTAEDYLKLIRSVLVSQPYSFIIIDSLSALSPQSELEADPSGDIRAKSPKLVSHFLKQICGVVRYNNCVLWSINQLYSNTSGYGAGYLADGGNRLMYLSDYFLMQANPARKIEYYPEGTNPEGQKLDWIIAFTANGSPGKTATSYLKYGYGLDEVMEVIELASGVGIIDKGGAWYTYGEHKFQGREKLYKELNNNKDLFSEIYSKVRELFGVGQCGSQTSKDSNVSGDSKAELPDFLRDTN